MEQVLDDGAGTRGVEVVRPVDVDDAFWTDIDVEAPHPEIYQARPARDIPGPPPRDILDSPRPGRARPTRPEIYQARPAWNRTWIFI